MLWLTAVVLIAVMVVVVAILATVGVGIGRAIVRAGASDVDGSTSRDRGSKDGNQEIQVPDAPRVGNRRQNRRACADFLSGSDSRRHLGRNE